MSTAALPRAASTRCVRALVRFGWCLPVLAIVAVWAFTTPFPFVFDDEFDILRNDAVHALWPPRWAFGVRRPLAWLTFALNWAWSGPRPWSFRLVNIVIHALNATLLWSCTRVALTAIAAEPGDASTDRLRGADTVSTTRIAAREAARTRRFGRVEAAAIATAVATLWAIHPLHTSAVTYIVHRYETLCALF
ncbi:MAG: hypothetical protein ACHREM_29200, partial [Polyangiales bacterium]